jgi:hypothetical protein
MASLACIIIMVWGAKLSNSIYYNWVVMPKLSSFIRLSDDLIVQGVQRDLPDYFLSTQDSPVSFSSRTHLLGLTSTLVDNLYLSAMFFSS